MAEERPLGTLGTLAVAAGLALALVAAGYLRWRGLLVTSFWTNDSGLAGLAFYLPLAAMLAGVVALQLVPERWARPLLTVEGALCLAAQGWPRAAIYLGGLVAFFFALEVPLPKLMRAFVPLALLLALGVLAGQGLIPTEPAYTFSLLFCARLMVYGWEKWQTDFRAGSLRDYLLYVLSPPLVVFPPFVVIVPFYSRHAARLQPRLTTARALAGFRHLATGLAYTVALVGILWLREKLEIGNRHTWQGHYWTFVIDVVKVARLAHLVYGLLSLHGLVDRLPIDWPLLSRSYVEFWKRFQIHQKDLQVAFFYNPVMLRLRRANRYAAIIAASATTLLAGNFVLHFLLRYVYDWGFYVHRLPSLLTWYGASFVVLAASLCLTEWRTRNHRPPPKSPLYAVLCWALTLTFTGFLMTL